MTESDERELLRLLNLPAGDGIGGIYDLLGRQIFFYILGILRSETAAEEVTQDFFVKLVANREKAIRANKPGSYLFQMARNEAVNFCRRTPPSAEPIGNFENVLSYQGSRRDLEELERHQALLRALDQLPDEQQEVISLKIFQEMTFAEIAGALGISANTAASRYRYAVTNLQRIMGDIIHEY